MQINQHQRLRKNQTRLTEADNNGMLLIDDVGEYAELIRQKMDFINRDNASAAEKIQEIKKIQKVNYIPLLVKEVPQPHFDFAIGLLK